VTATAARVVAGPHFDELTVEEQRSAPALTLTSGHVATHQAILGDRLPVNLDTRLSEQVFADRSRPRDFPDHERPS
jgi:hypothetical protein